MGTSLRLVEMPQLAQETEVALVVLSILLLINSAGQERSMLEAVLVVLGVEDLEGE